MINKKVFALSLVAASVIAAGCSSDDDDDPVIDEDQLQISTDAVDLNGDGTIDSGDDLNDDNIVNLADFLLADTDGDGELSDEEIAAVVAGQEVDPDVDPDPAPEVTEAELPDGSEYDPAGQVPPATLNLAELATAAELNSLVQNVAGCDFASALSDPESLLTVFAPDDEAFADAAVTDALGAGADVCEVIAGHVLTDTVATAADLTSQVGTVATTLAGTTVAIEAGEEEGTLTIGGSTVVLADQFATNGVAHVIDTVILPMADEDTDEETEEETGNGTPAPQGTPLAAIESDGSLSSFRALVDSSGFGNALADPVNNNWITFAPTNAAIDSSVTSAAAYIVTNQTGVTSAAPAPGSYTGTGEEAQTFEVAGEGENLTVNGEAAQYVVTGDGGALVKFGS